MSTRNEAYLRTKRSSARLGGLARVRMHGNPGTAEGRSRGGTRSLETHRKKDTRFKQRRPIRVPKRSAALAEFLGAMMGDGHVGAYQATLTTNATTDLAHARHIRRLAQVLFDIRPSLVMRSAANACVVIMSSVELCDFLERQGLPRGSKLRIGVRIPPWIPKNPAFSRACIRGLFDTDGSVYLDRHMIKGRSYAHVGLVFTNREPNILRFFSDALEGTGFNPTQTSRYAVFLRRAKEIDRYFELVGTSNPKHRKRYEQFRRTIRRGVRVVE